MRGMLGENAGSKRSRCRSKGQSDSDHTTYKRFRSWIIQRSSREAPAASTPLATGCQCDSSFEFDAVCQRLELDSPASTKNQAEEGEKAGNQGIPAITPHSSGGSASGKQQWMWTAAGGQYESAQWTGSDGRQSDPQPFAVLDKAFVCLQEKLSVTLAAPSLLNDYYSNLLDCSCTGLVALALGATVYIWNSESRSLVGHLHPSVPPGQQCRHSRSVSSLCWSGDGRTLCIGTRQGEVQLWDVEQKERMRRFTSHLSVVGALSWKQRLLSSGSVLGRIHHHDPRAPAPLVGAAVQSGGLCGLQWSPDGEWLASGSPEGDLRIWDSDVIGLTGSPQPIATMKQPSAVKALGWCPWQRKIIATGGGWKDGHLRIWDIQSGTCVTSADTNSQICALRWAESRRCLVTGHGLPHHHTICWAWDFPSLNPTRHLAGHSRRVLHLAFNPDGSQLFTAGADQRLHIWEV